MIIFYWNTIKDFSFRPFRFYRFSPCTINSGGQCRTCYDAGTGNKFGWGIIFFEVAGFYCLDKHPNIQKYNKYKELKPND